MQGPYAGLKVVELGRFIAAPYCAQLLADGGADVIKVEPLIGDDSRRNGTVLSPTLARQYLNKNRGKRTMAVDLSHPEVQAAVRALCATADVLIVNFRPGQAQKLGLDYEGLSTVNPRLIYAANTGYGNAGPLAADAGMDIVLQAYSGLANLTPRGPEPIADSIIDYMAGMLLAWGIATALFHRERSGAGQRLDTSLLQAALVLQNNTINQVDAVDGWRSEFVEYLKQAFSQGKTWQEILDRRAQLAGRAPNLGYYGLFPTRDGVIALAAGGRLLQKKVLQVLGVDDPFITDPTFKCADLSLHSTQMRERNSTLFKAQDTAHWLRVLADAGVPVGPVQLKEQLIDDEQVRANGYLTRMEHEEIGSITVVSPPVSFSASPLRVSAPPPPLGKHTAALLQEAGLDAATITRLAAAGAIHLGEQPT